MAKINPQQFTTEAFADQQSWIGKFFTPLNQFTGDVVRAFSNAISIEDNLFQEIKEIKWTNTPTNFPLKFRTKFAGVQPKGLFPIYLLNNTTGGYSTAAPWVVWSYQNNEVTITDVAGLVASNAYTIKLLVIYG